ncbi:hypothetical protein Pfo_031576 [Paulownia fortunei]|nr:hypothetical protein Pfo_031576 [Paulownia fortunei]
MLMDKKVNYYVLVQQVRMTMRKAKKFLLTYSDSAVDANNNFTLNVANEEKTGSVVLTKTDSDTNKILAGATFSLYKSDGTKVASDLTTDAKETAAPAGYNFDKDKHYDFTVELQTTAKDGQITKDGLKPGDYYFVETDAPAGYNFDKDKHYDFTVDLQTKTKTSDTNKVLAGATFSLYKADGTEVANDLTTNADGQINQNGLKPDNRKVATVSATNAQKTGSVVLTKTDSDTGKVLAGATFYLYKADGTEVAKDLTTKADGQINQDDLKPGYNFDKDKHYDFTCELQTTAKVVPFQQQTKKRKDRSVVLTKTDSDTNKVLAGATFEFIQS